MVSPIYLIVVILGAAFLHPLFEKAGKTASRVLVSAVLLFAAALPVSWFVYLTGSGIDAVIVNTAGFQAPLSINLRVGMEETLFLIMINTAALLGGLFFMLRSNPEWKGKVQVLFLTMLLGINGLILTRDLFNVFVFLEIASISLYALISFAKKGDAYEAGFKYMIAGGIAAALFLIGVIYIYRLTGTLNIDGIIAVSESAGGNPGASGILGGKAGVTAVFLVAAAMLIELKPFPANGWGVDAYEASDPGISAMASAVSATGIFFVFYKLIPLFSPDLLKLITISGGMTFFFSQLLAMKQDKVRRMLGYSSIGQLGLLILIAGLGNILNSSELLAGFSIPGIPISGGIFLLLILFAGSHLLSKAGLFWLSGIMNAENINGSGTNGLLRKRPAVAGLFGLLTAALAGLPPFPAFWAKWILIMALAATGNYFLTAVILLGSLIEAWYLFRWFLNYMKTEKDTGDIHDEIVPEDFPLENIEDASRAAGIPQFSSLRSIAAPFISALLLLAAGILPAISLLTANGPAGVDETILFLPLAALALFTVLDVLRIPIKLQVFAGIAVTAVYGAIIIPDLDGLRMIFGIIFIAGSAIQMFPLANREGRHPGLMGMLMAMIFSLGNLLVCKSSLGFFFSWELMTVTSFFLIARGEKASGASLRYLLFSLAGAFLILGGLAVGGSSIFADILPGQADTETVSTILLGLGFLIKMGSLGLHIWLPGSYAESEDDISTFFSTVLSKAGLYMLFITAGLFAAPLLFPGRAAGLFPQISLSSLLGWIGALTAFAGAFLALFKEDIKYTLAYSSMGQVGYMLLSFALMTQLGWMNSLYLAVTHLLFKGMLFVAVAGVIYRVKTRMMYQMGGLISRMPISFFTVLIAIIALSGVPPLTGFGAKWMLYTALIEKGWYLQAGIAMFASAIAFLYLFRLIHVIFLGQLKDEHRNVKEAPIWFLIPQVISIIGIMLFSMYPNTILKPLQNAILPYFPTGIEFDGYTVLSTLGYWNGNAVMFVTMGVFMVPLIWMLIVQRKNTQMVGQFNIVFAAERPYKPETTHFGYNFFAHYRTALGFLLNPGVTRFWKWTASIAEVTGSAVRKLYSGNIQTYVLLIVLYVTIFLLLLRGGF
ncbi:MAG: hypothetical protein KAQ69_07610 [Spirochaetales bacterium]|nr:hypothetical protein [Spirochaetales bacterium]